VDDVTDIAAFLITSVTAGQVSARARRHTEEAEANRNRIESLYAELHQEDAARKRVQKVLEKQAAELHEKTELLDLA
jgi:hypothetical protein